MGNLGDCLFDGAAGFAPYGAYHSRLEKYAIVRDCCGCHGERERSNCYVALSDGHIVGISNIPAFPKAILLPLRIGNYARLLPGKIHVCGTCKIEQLEILLNAVRTKAFAPVISSAKRVEKDVRRDGKRSSQIDDAVRPPIVEALPADRNIIRRKYRRLFVYDIFLESRDRQERLYCRAG